MMKKAIFDKLFTFYNDKAYTHYYIMGFELFGTIYKLTTHADTIAQWLGLDKASRGAGMAIRFKPTIEQKLEMVKAGAVELCSTEYFKAQCGSSKYNKGEIFEKLITEEAGQTWEKDNIPFTKAGDVEILGRAYQIKFQGATFINEKQMFKMMERGE